MHERIGDFIRIVDLVDVIVFSILMNRSWRQVGFGDPSSNGTVVIKRNA
jgi:hypothetical protein